MDCAIDHCAIDYCAIDFGTSNSAIAAPVEGAMRLIELEAGRSTMPTAVFYFADEPVGGLGPEGLPRAFGRAAVEAYIDGNDGRLMRSMKSILGSDLVDRATDVGGGRSAKYLDVVSGYLRHLRQKAEAASGTTIRRAVVGRPVFFVDDDPVRDAQAQAALAEAAAAIGLDEVRFQYEPIAAAFDHERRIDREQIVLVADIGGGTSDFSIVRVGPERARRLDRRADILANHGVHLAGTDFDRRVTLATILPLYGLGAEGPSGAGGSARAVPSGVYFDLATWHLVNTVYAPARVAELRAMRRFYADPHLHARLMRVLDERLGHELLGLAESAKIEVANACGGTDARIDLRRTEPGLAIRLTPEQAAESIAAEIARIVAAAREAVARAGLGPDAVDALYFTGGSTGLTLLTDRIAAAFPRAVETRGDRFASVANGLALYAERLFGAQAPR